MECLRPRDFTDPEIQVCPFPRYDELRATSPVYQEPSTGYYVVLDHGLVQELAADKVRLINGAGVMTVKDGPIQAKIDAIVAEHGVRMVEVLTTGDDPDHAFHRALVERTFLPGRVKQMEDYLQTMIADCIDGFIDDGRVEFISQMAVLVPMSVIADQLGVPREDLPLFKQWSDARVARAQPGVSEARVLELTLEICKLQRYLVDRAEEYRAAPRDCILSDLVHADVDGRGLTIEEIVAIASTLIVAGNETTTAAMANGLQRLIDEPDLQARLRETPALIPKFVEEVLRLDTPLQGLFRRATVDLDIAGVHVPAGSVVVLRWGAANRDPAKFPHPHDVDLERANGRQHVAFGYGPHVCIGSQLARSELRLAFHALLSRARNFRAAPGASGGVRHPHYMTFGMREQHVAFDKAE